MAISTNYATPVTVNGFECKNCTDVDYAKKYIDPAHPKSGPFGIDKQTDPTQSPAVKYGGSLSDPGASGQAQTGGQPQQAYRVGGQVDISA